MTKRNKIKNSQNESSVNFASYFSRLSIEKYLDRFENNDPEDPENDNL